MALRIGGQDVSAPAEEVLVLPRAKAADIIITARAVLSMEEFEMRVPEPQARAALVAGKGKVQMTNDPQFKKDMDTYSEKRFAFMAIKSLEPSNIEWEKVSLEEPNTWSEWTEELKGAGFSDVEVQRVIVCIMQANSLDENKLKEARESFLQGLEETVEPSFGPDTEPPSTSSGQVASDGE